MTGRGADGDLSIATRVGASSLTLAGLLEHLAVVEDLKAFGTLDLLEEYGRHLGHADLLREAVDGRVGEDPPPGWSPVGRQGTS